MAIAMDESKTAGAKRDARTKLRQRWRQVATIFIGVQRRKWMMVFEGVGDL